MSCDGIKFLNPAGVEVPKKDRTDRSDLGFQFSSDRDYVRWGGTITEAHGDFADKWWIQLMNDLFSVGFKGASDPSDIFGWTVIKLRKPEEGTGLISCDNFSSKQGACYHIGSQVIEVPGDYPTATRSAPNSQPLKHEYFHHCCWNTRGDGCTTKDEDGYKVHFFPAPNDPNFNLWNLTWDRNQSTTSFHQQYEQNQQNQEYIKMLDMTCPETRRDVQ